MRIAYLILAHKNPEQLIRLISRLNSEKASFFVHLDKKTDNQIYLQLLKALESQSNVYFLERQAVYWGEFSGIEVTFKSLERIIESGVPFDYVKLLSGQDYPLKSNKQIEQFLSENRGKSFIEFFILPSPTWEKNGGLDRVQYWHFRLFNRFFCFPLQPNFDSRSFIRLCSPLFLPFSFIRRKFPKGFTPYGGSTLWCLSRECAEYVANFVNQHPQFVKRFHHTLCADEIFFQTILLNSPFKGCLVNDDLTYTAWLENSPNPEVLSKANIEDLLASSYMFARKFDTSKDADVLDMIDQKLSERSSIQ